MSHGRRGLAVRWDRPSRFPEQPTEFATALTGRLCLVGDRTDHVTAAIERLGVVPATGTVTFSWSP